MKVTYQGPLTEIEYEDKPLRVGDVVEVSVANLAQLREQGFAFSDAKETKAAKDKEAAPKD